MGENGVWILVIVILLLVFWSFSRRRRPRSNKLETAMSLISDINHNIKVLEIRTADHMSKKNFKVINWMFYKDRVDFLKPEVVAALNESFTIAEEFKNKIDVAKKNKNMETLQAMDLSRLKGPLDESRKGLVTWLKENVNTEMQTNTRRNWLGF
ncbi:MAG: hypothetical protein JXA46_00690 [Dehalococcoidales bacterium]|nr:hypothetical protein [Dehalococcoidales bacterium]